MFKRANKITALLVAAASVMSIVPAMAADSTRLGTKDGTIEKAIAFDGKYIYEGYKGDTDKAVYFNDGAKDKELTDYEDYTFTTATYGEKYALAEDGGDQYLVDLSNGNISDDTLEDKYDTAASKLEKALKKTDKYDGAAINGGVEADLKLVKSSAKFQEEWYSVKTAATKNNTIFTDGNGKYVDSSVLANIYAYSTVKGKVVKVEKFDTDYSDSGLKVEINKQPEVIAQDKDYLYAITNVKITDSKSEAAGAKETYVINYTTGASVTIAGTTFTNPAKSVNDVYVAAQDAYDDDYTVTKSGNVVTITAKTVGDVTTPLTTATTGTFKRTVIGADKGTVVDGNTPDTTYAWYLQKISKAQGDTDEEAYEPKTVVSYQLDNKSLYDNGDVSDAFGWLIEGTVADPTKEQLNNSATSKIDDTIYNVEVKDNSLYVYKLTDSDTVKVLKLDLKQIKENPMYKDTTEKFGTTKLDGYVVKKDGDTDQDFDAIDVDINGIVWVLRDGKVIKFAEKDKTTVYTCDSGLNELDVYDAKNLIAWNYDDERYTTVTEGTSVTQGEAAVVAPAAPTTGWVKNTDGTWSFNDYTGVKVASKWLFLGGSWYYIKADGIMATGWYNDNGTWYYLNASGAMVTGWFQDVDGNWYYLASSGAMLANTTVDGYKLGASGAWIR